MCVGGGKAEEEGCQYYEIQRTPLLSDINKTGIYIKESSRKRGGGSKVTAVYSSDYIITGGCSKGPAG